MTATSEFEKTEGSLALLMQSLARVLDGAGAAAVAERLPWRDLWADAPEPGAVDFPPEIAEACVQAYSVALQLLSQAEENGVAQARRALEATEGLASDPGSWDQQLAALGEAGHGAPEIAEALGSVRVEPVLTAHPTEAKRQTVLEHHRALYRILVELENSMWTPAERADLERQLEAWLERLWRTGEIYLEKPSLQDERRAVLHYLRDVFPHALPWVTQRLEAAWARAGFDPALIAHPSRLPRLELGDWVGGDRDGHPFVTAEITQETLALFRRSALEMLDERLQELGIRLSLSELRQAAPAALKARIDELAYHLGEAGQAALSRNAEEPWRQYVNLVRAALPLDGAGYASADRLLEDLERLRASLLDIGAPRLAREDLDPVIGVVRTFGFHLATLDVRQNSAFHDRALGQLARMAGDADGEGYPEWDLARRRAWLERELDTPRPFALARDVRDPEASAVLDVYRVLAEHRRRHGPEGLGALIVSMTRSAEDLIGVYVLARDAGLLEREGDEVRCPLQVVPLFETIDDLANAPDVLDAYLGHPVVKRSLERQRELRGEAQPVQQVMIGYSDSGKDGGIVASMWSLYRAQARLSEVGRAHGVRVRFFHGRGGTIGRGAGPTHRFLRAFPPGTLQGDLRMTEQGETISQKYANKVTAAHHLELLLAGTLGTTLLDRAGRSDPPELLALLDGLAETSRVAYRDLVERDGFLQFFAEATPIDAIEASRIGSRPARRTGKRSLADLRAIPWVFAWNQARFVLPGWYGLGSALEGLRERDAAAFERLIEAKGEANRWAPLHYLISNAATALMTSSLEVMEAYAQLVTKPEVRDDVLGAIRAEHRRTREALEAIYGGDLFERRPRMRRVLERRHAALLPLHRHQIGLLSRWRRARAEERTMEADAHLVGLLVSINAIASGLGATG